MLIYEIFPMAFVKQKGDGFKNIKNHLSYVKELGFSAIWLTPIFKSPFKDSGYDISDYYNFNPDFGTKNDFLELINEAKRLNLEVILDIVLNHTSDKHDWFEKSRNRVEPYSDYYIWKKGIDKLTPPNNWKCEKINDSTWKYCEIRGEFYLHIYSDFQPDLNWQSKSMIQELADVIKYYADLGVCGFRLDVINKIGKDLNFYNLEEGQKSSMYYVNHPTTFTYLNEFKSILDQNMTKEVFFIGQCEGVNLTQAQQYLKTLDHILTFRSVNYGKLPFLNKSAYDIKDVFSSYREFNESLDIGSRINFIASHDTARVSSRYNQYGADVLAKSLAIYTILMPGTSVVYFGDELGAKNADFRALNEFDDIRSHESYEVNLEHLGHLQAFELLRENARDHARQPINFTDFKNDYYILYKRLIELRKSFKDISNLKFYETDKIVSYQFESEKKSVKVAVYFKESKLNNDDDILFTFNVKDEIILRGGVIVSQEESIY